MSTLGPDLVLAPGTPRSDGARLDPEDRPRRLARRLPDAGLELGLSVVAALGITVVLFTILVGSVPPVGTFVVALIVFLVVYGVVSRLRHGPFVMKDRLAAVYVWVGGALALFPLAQIIWTVTAKGAPVVLDHFPKFLVNDSANAGPLTPVWQSGVGHAIVGTVEQVGIATLLTVPIATLSALYLSESDSPLSGFIRTMVNAMMGTPSIIAGLFVYLFWVQPRGVSGYSGFAAAIALGILMLPLMIRTAEEVIRVVPGSLREAGHALGAPNWRVSLRIVLPTVRTGVITALILGVALAVGETAPTLFTAHGSAHYNWNPFQGNQANLPLQIFANIESFSPNFVREGYGAAFVLIFMVLSLFVVARFIGSSTPGRRRVHLRRRRAKEVVVS
ncbi:MAG TPA: phosphate ABC transporter permease PstA [Acidimicrobiales bacterium]|nr:phosphate ABC transporter permease PstA [Acidimicrobiales bacterium]